MSVQQVNKRIIKEIELSDYPADIKDIAKHLLNLELGRWMEQNRWKFRQEYEAEINKAALKRGEER